MNYGKLENREYIISELPCASVSKRVFVENLSLESKFDLKEKEPVEETHFHIRMVSNKDSF